MLYHIYKQMHNTSLLQCTNVTLYIYNYNVQCFIIYRLKQLQMIHKISIIFHCHAFNHKLKTFLKY